MNGKGEPMRLIDADELNKAMFHGVAEIVPEDEHSPKSYKRGWNDALEAVADKSCTSTIDAVPVIRCKDCVHYKGHWYCETWNNSPGFPAVKEDGFCNMAERRTDETD